MKHDFFTVPFFTDKVDLDKITLIDESQEPTFRSQLMSCLLYTSDAADE